MSSPPWTLSIRIVPDLVRWLNGVIYETIEFWLAAFPDSDIRWRGHANGEKSGNKLLPELELCRRLPPEVRNGKKKSMNLK